MQLLRETTKGRIDSLSVIKVLPEGDIGYGFCSVELEQRYLYARHKHVSFCYFLLHKKTIISFSLFMDESINLILGFLEYQIPNKTHRLNLAKKFKALSEKTLYLNYIYTDNLFRHQHLTSWFLKYIITEEKMLFSYIWLRREINSTLFDRCGFINFCWAVEEIIGRTDFKEYFEENKSPAFMLENHEYMVNLIRS